MLESLPSAACDDAIAPDSGAAAIPPTDGERLMRFERYRDEAAFAQVVEAHAKMVWGVCSQILRHQQDVEDAFQATFFILARKAKSIRAADNAAGWLYRVAFRTALLARERRLRRLEAPLVDEPRSLDDQLAAVERSEQSLALLEELNALPQRYRQPLVLCYMEGRSRREAADEMGVTSQAVKGLLARGTRMLRSRLVRRGAALSTSMAAVSAAMAAAQVSAAPTLVAATASLGMSFALKTKLTLSGIKGATLQGGAACTLAEKGIWAMTIAAASKPAVGVLGVVLTAGMLAIADAEPAKTLVVGGGGESLFLVAAEDEANDSAAGATVELAASKEASEGEAELDVAVDVFADAVGVTVPASPAARAVTSSQLLDAPGAVAISAAGAPPMGAAGNVVVANDAPPPANVPAQLSENVELARKFDFQYAAGNPSQFAALTPTLTGAPASTSGGSEAALKLEGEYWDLKAAGLKKKADAIQLKVKQANARLQTGTGEMNEGEILELAAEKDLTLAEVKLCEMNSQRVRDALEERTKNKEGEQQTQIEIKKALEAVAAAQYAAKDELKRAAEAAAKQANDAKAQAAEAAKAAAKAWSIRAETPAIVVERRVAETKPPAPPTAPQPPKAIRIEQREMGRYGPPEMGASMRRGSEMGMGREQSADPATLSKEELKKLLDAVEAAKKLEKRVKELEQELKRNEAEASNDGFKEF